MAKNMSAHTRYRSAATAFAAAERANTTPELTTEAGATRSRERKDRTWSI